MTTETKRQKQVAGLINEELNDIFRRMSMTMMDGGMISISSVKFPILSFTSKSVLPFRKITIYGTEFKVFRLRTPCAPYDSSTE